MEINLEYYKLFYEVAKYGNFSKAAEHLYISQPAITQVIKKLENNLGGALFYRNVKGVSLTEEGENLYNFIENSIETLNNAEDRFKQYKELKKGKIAIKGTNTIIKHMLNKPLLNFIKDYPDIKIDVLSGGHNDTLKDLSQGNVDLALLNLPVSFDYKNIQIIELCEKELIFVMSKEYEKKKNVNITQVKDILQYDLIAPRRGTKYREVLDFMLLNENNEDNEYKYEIMSAQMQIQFAKENVGIAFVLKEMVEKELKNNELIEIKLKEKAKIKIGIGVLKNKIMNYATKELLKYLL